MDNDYNERMVVALKVERAGYVERGLTDRIKQVDKQLAAYGAEVEPKVRKPRASKKDEADVAQAEDESAAEVSVDAAAETD